MLKNYYYLTKPGIVYGNTMAAAAGFLLAAARGGASLGLFLATVLGVALIIASACVFNNYIDRDIDAVMARTKRRALVSGKISGPAALVYGAALALLGSALLATFANLLAMTTALAGWVLYVVVYGYFKRHTVFGTEIGSLSGAVPPVAGYVAVTGHFDLAAGLLFLILILWQMPHFYAIAMFRKGDYAAAAVPVLPVKRGNPVTKKYIVVYMVLLALAAPLFYYFGYTGQIFLVETAAVSLGWLIVALRTWSSKDDARWARQVFSISLIVLINFCLMWAVGGLLP